MTTKKIKFTMNQLVKLMGMTQKDLAKEMGLSESAVFKKLNNKSSWKAIEVGFILDLAKDKLDYDLSLDNLQL